VNKFRFISIENIVMILAGYNWHVSIKDLINMACLLESDIFEDEYKLSDIKTLLYNTSNAKYNIQKTELMIDNFIELLLIMQQIHSIIDKNNIEDITDELKKVCKQLHVEYRSIMNAIELSESIIYQLALIGLNPYQWNEYNFENIINNPFDSNKLEYINKIKQCIFEGYKLNIAVWNAADKKYYTRKSHIPLQINSDFIQTFNEIEKYGDSNPKYIIFDKITYLYNPKNNMYDAKVNNICIIDGYIPYDVNFDTLVI
jgi:hypothetical protein